MFMHVNIDLLSNGATIPEQVPIYTPGWRKAIEIKHLPVFEPATLLSRAKRPTTLATALLLGDKYIIQELTQFNLYQLNIIKANFRQYEDLQAVEWLGVGVLGTPICDSGVLPWMSWVPFPDTCAEVTGDV